MNVSGLSSTVGVGIGVDHIALSIVLVVLALSVLGSVLSAGSVLVVGIHL